MLCECRSAPDERQAAAMQLRCYRLAFKGVYGIAGTAQRSTVERFNRGAGRLSKDPTADRVWRREIAVPKPELWQRQRNICHDAGRACDLSQQPPKETMGSGVL